MVGVALDPSQPLPAAPAPWVATFDDVGTGSPGAACYVSGLASGIGTPEANVHMARGMSQDAAALEDTVYHVAPPPPPPARVGQQQQQQQW